MHFALNKTKEKPKQKRFGGKIKRGLVEVKWTEAEEEEAFFICISIQSVMCWYESYWVRLSIYVIHKERQSQFISTAVEF